MVSNCIVCKGTFDLKTHQPRNIRYTPNVCSSDCFAALLSPRQEVYVNEELIDTQHSFRSKYEEAFAEWMVGHNIKFLYEEISLLVKPNSLYIPDFWLPEAGIMVEVKGLWEHSNGKCGAYTKFKTFVEKFGINAYVLDKMFLRRIGCKLR